MRKRSIALLLFNILTTVECLILLCILGGLGIFTNKAMSEISNQLNVNLNIPDSTLETLIWLSVASIMIGPIVGWIAYGCKNAGLALGLAIFCLITNIGMILVFWGVIITIVLAFAGAVNQRKLNKWHEEYARSSNRWKQN